MNVHVHAPVVQNFIQILHILWKMQRGGHQFVGSCVLQASAVEYQLAPTDTSVDTTHWHLGRELVGSRLILDFFMRASTSGRLSTDCWSSVSQVLTKCRPSIEYWQRFRLRVSIKSFDWHWTTDNNCMLTTACLDYSLLTTEWIVSW